MKAKKYIKKLRLKRKWYFVLGMLTMLFLIISMYKYFNFYGEYLENCDKEKGYTCNIFGQ